MNLLDVYETPLGQDVLWQLLVEREPHQSISHKGLPTWENHLAFVRSRPYEAWYLIESGAGRTVGAVYLTRQREIGVGILKAHRGLGFAEQAIAELMHMHPGRFLANINPANFASINLFKKLGFGGPIQITLEKT